MGAKKYMVWRNKSNVFRQKKQSYYFLCLLFCLKISMDFTRFATEQLFPFARTQLYGLILFSNELVPWKRLSSDCKIKKNFSKMLLPSKVIAFYYNSLTLKCPSVNASRLCPRRGLKTFFLVEFFAQNCTIDRGYQALLICEEKNVLPFQNADHLKKMFRVILQYHEIWKTTFPMDFFLNEIWLLSDYQ